MYFQSSRPIVQRLGFQLGKRTNLNEFESIYGFNGETNLAHVQAPMVQVGDILHPQTDEYGGLRPIVVPVGVDQDPHLRLTRGLAAKTNWFNVNDGKSSGVVIGLSVQEDNAEVLGQMPNGRLDKIVSTQSLQVWLPHLSISDSQIFFRIQSREQSPFQVQRQGINLVFKSNYWNMNVRLEGWVCLPLLPPIIILLSVLPVRR